MPSRGHRASRWPRRLHRHAVRAVPGREQEEGVVARDEAVLVAFAVVPVAGPRVDFSASELRRILAAGQSVRYQVPDQVAEYIKDHELYRN